MPRRPATIERDIPLYLVPHIVLLGVRRHGEDLERMIVRKTRNHFYNISTRTRPIKRELRKSGNGAGVQGDGRDKGEKI